MCLSLLNTWSGKESEKWDPKRSSLLQVLVSIQGLVLVQKPYFNEAGFDKQVGTAAGEKNAILYNESAHLLCLKLMINTLQRPPISFETLVRDHFSAFSHLIRKSMDDYASGTTIGFSECANTFDDTEGGGGGGEANAETLEPSEGFKIMLSQIKPHLLAALDAKGKE